MVVARRKTLGRWTIATVTLGLLAGLFVPGALASHVGPAPLAPLAVPGTGPAVAAPTTVATGTAPTSHPTQQLAAHPSNATSPNVTASANITSNLTGPQAIPVMVSWTINVTGAIINKLNVSMSLLIMNGANEVANWSQPVMTNTTSYSAMVNYAVLTVNNYNNSVLPTTPYSFTIWVQALNFSNGSVAWTNDSSPTVTTTLQIANAAVLVTTVLPLYDSLPFPLNFTTSFGGNSGGVVNKLNVTISIETRYVSSGCNHAIPCQTIANNSVTFNGSDSYQMTIDQSYFLSNPLYGGQIPLGEYQVIEWCTFANINNPAQAPRVVSGSVYIYPVMNPNAATFLSPASNGNVSSGNVGISVAYTTDFLTSANVTVYQGSTSTVVFSAGVFLSGLVYHWGSAVWTGATPGAYTVVLAIVTVAGAASGQSTFSEKFNVTAAAGSTTGGGTVYVNSSTWHNSSGSLVGGLSPGVGAAILLVAGLVVGMIVAMALAMMMRSGPKASAQPWTAKGNECSICHQSFPTEQELKDHQKQAHGM